MSLASRTISMPTYARATQATLDLALHLMSARMNLMARRSI